MSRGTTFATGEYFHIYNRGTEKRKIFLDMNDYERLLSLLYVTNSPVVIHRSDHFTKKLNEILAIPRESTLVDIGAYCLMPNHFHLLLHEHTENGISTFMQKLGTAYTMYFNKKCERKGSLFESTFHARHASGDEYLKYLFAYIHLNPMGLISPEWKEKHRVHDKKSAYEYLKNYRYSSYLDYADSNSKRPEDIILHKTSFPEYFENPTEFVDFTKYWMEPFEPPDNVKV